MTTAVLMLDRRVVTTVNLAMIRVRLSDVWVSEANDFVLTE